MQGNNLVLNFTPTPEPGAVLLVCAAGFALAARFRRRLHDSRRAICMEDSSRRR
jgi:hypothetical protein